MLGFSSSIVNSVKYAELGKARCSEKCAENASSRGYRRTTILNVAFARHALRTAFLILASLLTAAQNAPRRTARRYVQGQTLISDESPAAQLTFSAACRYIGAQVVSLYGNAEAEQHLFVRGPESGPVQSLYWVQFEHFLPTNRMTYEYENQRPVDINGFLFTYDVKSFRDYAYMQNEDSHSDGAAISRLLALHHLAFPARAARVRMVYLPTPDHRTELMIIYAEAVAENSSVPIKSAKDEGVILNDAAPQAASELLASALAGLTLRKM